MRHQKIHLLHLSCKTEKQIVIMLCLYEKTIKSSQRTTLQYFTVINISYI